MKGWRRIAEVQGHERWWRRLGRNPASSSELAFRAFRGVLRGTLREGRRNCERGKAPARLTPKSANRWQSDCCPSQKFRRPSIRTGTLNLRLDSCLANRSAATMNQKFSSFDQNHDVRFRLQVVYTSRRRSWISSSISSATNPRPSKIAALSQNHGSLALKCIFSPISHSEQAPPTLTLGRHHGCRRGWVDQSISSRTIEIADPYRALVGVRHPRPLPQLRTVCQVFPRSLLVALEITNFQPRLFTAPPRGHSYCESPAGRLW